MNVIGFDPGTKGVLVLLENGIPTRLLDLEEFLISEKTGKKYIRRMDILELKSAIYKFVEGSYCRWAIIERTGAWHKDMSKQSAYSLGWCSAAVESILIPAIAPFCDNVIYVTPQIWKRDLGLSRYGAKLTTAEKKKLSIETAKQLIGWKDFASKYLTRVKDHDRAEAALIGRWGFDQIAHSRDAPDDTPA